jgi:hypothetical protein
MHVPSEQSTLFGQKITANGVGITKRRTIENLTLKPSR